MIFLSRSLFPFVSDSFILFNSRQLSASQFRRTDCVEMAISHYHLDNGEQIEFVSMKTSKSIKYTNESATGVQMEYRETGKTMTKHYSKLNWNQLN